MRRRPKALAIPRSRPTTKYWLGFRRNPKGRGGFFRSLCRSSLKYTRYFSLLASRTRKNPLPSLPAPKLITGSRAWFFSPAGTSKSFSVRYSSSSRHDHLPCRRIHSAQCPNDRDACVCCQSSLLVLVKPTGPTLAETLGSHKYSSYDFHRVEERAGCSAQLTSTTILPNGP